LRIRSCEPAVYRRVGLGECLALDHHHHVFAFYCPDELLCFGGPLFVGLCEVRIEAVQVALQFLL
jgi:hypothetical protein